jgi:hypothetical protein
MKTLLQIVGRTLVMLITYPRACHGRMIRSMSRTERRRCEALTLSMHAQAREMLAGRARKFG